MLATLIPPVSGVHWPDAREIRRELALMLARFPAQCERVERGQVVTRPYGYTVILADKDRGTAYAVAGRILDAFTASRGYATVQVEDAGTVDVSWQL